MRLVGVLTTRYRGFRVIDIAALAIFLTLALGVYAFKTSAGRERSDIADVESQIRDETHQVRLLKDQAARMEDPNSLEPKARAWANQAPVNATQEITPDALSQVAQSGAHP